LRHPFYTDVETSPIKEKDPDRASEIYNIRNTDKPYLLVLLEGPYPDGAEHALLKGLQDALIDPGRGNLPEDVLKTSYQSALKKIEEWEEKRPEFSQRLRELLHEEQGQSSDDLKYNLMPGCKDKAYRLFKELHQKITLSPFIPLFSEKASEIYPQISELLIREHGYRGIAIIWDQFNEHLEYFHPAFLPREVSFLRDFVEKVERSADNQLHWILVSHNLPCTYLRGRISEESLDNWKTLEGRFKQHRLTAVEEAEELVDYAIVKVKEEEEWNKVSEQIEKGLARMVDAIVELNLYPDKDRDWIANTICEGAFPLHPLTTYCLPLVSDMVGQEAQTMFTFFEEGIKEGGLARFISENQTYTEDGKLNFYTADKLFDFFKEAAENTPETKHVIMNYNEAMGKVSDKTEILTQRVMKAIGIVGMIEVKFPLIPLLSTLSNLALLLDLEEGKLKPLLDSLVEGQVLWVKANDEYEFRSGQALVNFDEDFRKEKEGLSWDNPVYILESEYSPGVIIARKYTEQYRVIRALLCKYIDTGELDNIKFYENRIRNEYLDGIALYVVAESMDDIEEARKKAINIRHPQLVVAVPKNPVNIYETLKGVRALESLRNKPPYNMEGTEAHKICEDRYDAEKGKLDNQITSWRMVSDLDWFREGVTLEAADKKAQDIADFVMSKVFDKTPIVEHRKMANRWEQDDRAHRFSLNTVILDTKRDELGYVAKGKAPAEKTILEQTFEPQGMLGKRREGNLDYFRFVKPTAGNMKEVWGLMEMHLTKSGGRANFTKLVGDLQLPPYGLCPRVIELFLSAFLRFHRNHLTIKTKRTKTSPWEKRDFIGETIHEVVDEPEPEKVLIEYREQLPLEEDYLLEVNSIVSPDKMPESRLSYIDGVGELFATWFQNLPLVTKCNIEDEKCKGFIREIGDVDRDRDMRELLLEKLPRALGIDKGFEYWEKGDLENFKDTSKGVVDGLNNYLEEVVVRKSMGCFKAVFDVKGDTESDVMGKIRNWYHKLGAAVKEHRFSGSTAQLIRHANIQSTDRFKEKFLVGLPKELGLSEYTKWENVEETLKKYEEILSKSKAEIDTFHMKVTGESIDIERLSPGAEALKASLKQVIDKKVIGRDEIVLALESLLEEYRR